MVTGPLRFVYLIFPMDIDGYKCHVYRIRCHNSVDLGGYGSAFSSPTCSSSTKAESVNVLPLLLQLRRCSVVQTVI